MSVAVTSQRPFRVSSQFTVAFEALVYQAVEKGSTVVAEGRRRVRVALELVLRPVVLDEKEGVCSNWVLN